LRSGREVVANEGKVSRKDIEGEQEAWGSCREEVANEGSEQEAWVSGREAVGDEGIVSRKDIEG